VAEQRGRPDASGAADIARMQDYWRGGTDNFPADRRAAEHASAAYPDLAASIRANRAFQARAVRYLAGPAGLRQFLDIGTGLPAEGSVGALARAIAPGCSVVYADNDPTVAGRSAALLAAGPPGTTAFLDADLRDVAALTSRAAATLDLSAPVAVMLVSVLHMITDQDDPHRIVADLMSRMPHGSYLVVTHVAADIDPAAIAEMARRVNQHAARSATPRSRAAVTRFFDGLDLVPPGVVRAAEWRPDSADEAASPSAQWAGVARKA